MGFGGEVGATVMDEVKFGAARPIFFYGAHSGGGAPGIGTDGGGLFSGCSV